MRFSITVFLTSAALWISSLTFAFATAAMPDQSDVVSSDSQSSVPDQRWLILGRIRAVKRLNDGLSNDGNTIAPPIWQIELDHIEVVTGPTKEYTGPRVIQIAASHVEKGLPDTYFNIVVSNGRARALEWARVSRVACFDVSTRDPEYDDFYFQFDEQTVCVGVGRYLGEFVEGARGEPEGSGLQEGQRQ